MTLNRIRFRDRRHSGGRPGFPLRSHGERDDPRNRDERRHGDEHGPRREPGRDGHRPTGYGWDTGGRRRRPRPHGAAPAGPARPRGLPVLPCVRGLAHARPLAGSDHPRPRAQRGRPGTQRVVPRPRRAGAPRRPHPRHRPAQRAGRGEPDGERLDHRAGRAAVPGHRDARRSGQLRARHRAQPRPDRGRVVPALLPHAARAPRRRGRRRGPLRLRAVDHLPVQQPPAHDRAVAGPSPGLVRGEAGPRGRPGPPRPSPWATVAADPRGRAGRPGLRATVHRRGGPLPHRGHPAAAHDRVRGGRARARPPLRAPVPRRHAGGDRHRHRGAGVPAVGAVRGPAARAQRRSTRGTSPPTSPAFPRSRRCRWPASPQTPA